MSTPPIGSELGLVGYWNFNEGSGSILTDQTSNGNNGSIVGATWSDDVPVFGCTDPYADNYNSNADADDGSCAGYPNVGEYSLGFDGVDDYIELAGRPINSNTSDLSVGLWFKSTQTVSGPLYFESVISGRGVWIRMEPGANRIRTYSGSSGASNIVSVSYTHLTLPTKA